MNYWLVKQGLKTVYCGLFGHGKGGEKAHAGRDASEGLSVCTRCLHYRHMTVTREWYINPDPCP
jgi:hypothetical protein